MWSRCNESGMKRHVLNFLVALSLLLCMAVCVLWVRSYFVVTWASHYAPRSLKSIALSGGKVLVSWDGGSDYRLPADKRWNVGSRPRTDEADDPKRERPSGTLGFGY